MIPIYSLTPYHLNVEYLNKFDLMKEITIRSLSIFT